MRRFSSILVIGLLLASCNAEETADDEKVEVEREQTEVVNPETELDEDYEAVLEFYTSDELDSLIAQGEILIRVFYNKMDDPTYTEIKNNMSSKAQNDAASFAGNLDDNKKYEVRDIEHEYVQGEDAPKVKVLYTVKYVEIENEFSSEEKINEFRIVGSNRTDGGGLAILEFEDKTHLDANSLFN